jgi:NAD(P)-dependent dehydrogenase (short-subunit alcohol dehydrogenase family)
MLFEGKVAIISGCGIGVGRTLALMMAKEGAKLVISARAEGRLSAIAEEVRSVGGEIIAVSADVVKRDHCRNVVDKAVERFGKIDVLVNLAFAAVRRGPVAGYTEEDLELWRRSMETGTYGTMLMCHYTAPHMIAAGSGSIVNVSSLSSRNGYKDRSDWAAGKAGINVLSMCLCDELGPHGIRVNVVAPGHIWSEGLKKLYENLAMEYGRTYEEELSLWLEEIALRRIPRPEEVAWPIMFMASDMASAVTGAILDVNGGHRLQFHAGGRRLSVANSGRASVQDGQE